MKTGVFTPAFFYKIKTPERPGKLKVLGIPVVHRDTYIAVNPDINRDVFTSLLQIHSGVFYIVNLFFLKQLTIQYTFCFFYS